jgi:hypothetical protein
MQIGHPILGIHFNSTLILALHFKSTYNLVRPHLVFTTLVHSSSHLTLIISIWYIYLLIFKKLTFVLLKIYWATMEMIARKNSNDNIFWGFCTWPRIPHIRSNSCWAFGIFQYQTSDSHTWTRHLSKRPALWQPHPTKVGSLLAQATDMSVTKKETTFDWRKEGQEHYGKFHQTMKDAVATCTNHSFGLWQMHKVRSHGWKGFGQEPSTKLHMNTLIWHM